MTSKGTEDTKIHIIDYKNGKGCIKVGPNFIFGCIFFLDFIISIISCLGLCIIINDEGKDLSSIGILGCMFNAIFIYQIIKIMLTWRQMTYENLKLEIKNYRNLRFVFLFFIIIMIVAALFQLFMAVDIIITNESVGLTKSTNTLPSDNQLTSNDNYTTDKSQRDFEQKLIKPILFMQISCLIGFLLI